MADDDSIDDDVFETKDTNTLNIKTSGTTPSPTGYRDYKPPDEVLRLCQTDNIEELEQTVHKVRIFEISEINLDTVINYNLIQINYF